MLKFRQRNRLIYWSWHSRYCCSGGESSNREALYAWNIRRLWSSYCASSK